MTINVYLDIDGVMLPYGQDTPHEETVDFINQLNSLEETNMIWATTHEHKAVSAYAPQFGISQTPVWDVLTCDYNIHDRDYIYWYKFPEVRNHLKETNPHKAVWIDDEIFKHANSGGLPSLKKFIIKNKEKLLCLSPHKNIGLTEYDHELITSFIHS